MRLTLKLTFAFFVTLATLVVLQGFVRYSLGMRAHVEEQDRDHAHVASALARLVGYAWALEGQERAFSLLANAETAEAGLQIRLVCTGTAADEAERARCASLRTLAPSGVGGAAAAAPTGLRRTWVEPVFVQGETIGFIEVSEPNDAEMTWRRQRIEQVALFGVSLAVSTAVVALVAGIWLVARPTRQLVSKALAVGRGDLDPPLVLRTRDEFEVLAEAMNSMCARLAEARRVADEESAQRGHAIDQLRHAERLATVGTLTSGLAHELGTPLSVVTARAEMLAAREGLPKGASRDVEAIVDACDRMTRIVQQVLVFSRRGVLREELLDPHEALASAAEFVRPVARKADVELEVARTSSTPRFRGDPVLVQQALVNVIVNAIHASSPGARVSLETSPTVEASRAGRPPRVTMRVIDHGTGIAPEVADRIFEPFFTTKAPGAGTGLGLAVAHAIVTEHQGTIDVSNTPGGGTTFAMSFEAAA